MLEDPEFKKKYEQAAELERRYLAARCGTFDLKKLLGSVEQELLQLPSNPQTTGELDKKIALLTRIVSVAEAGRSAVYSSSGTHVEQFLDAFENAGYGFAVKELRRVAGIYKSMFIGAKNGTANDGMISLEMGAYKVDFSRLRRVKDPEAASTGFLNLYEDGGLHFEGKKIASLPRDFARMFIAAISGTGELNAQSLSDMEKNLLGRINGAASCLPETRNCSEAVMDDIDAHCVTSLKNFTDGLESDAVYKAEAEKVRGLENALTSKSVDDQPLLIKKIDDLRGQMTALPFTVVGLLEKAAILKRMIMIATAIEAEERAAKRMDEEVKMRVEIPKNNAQAKRLRKVISKTEGIWRTRFTEAYDAAMACMPEAKTFEEEYCVSQNRLAMARGVLAVAKELNKIEEDEAALRSLVDREGDHAFYRFNSHGGKGKWFWQEDTKNVRGPGGKTLSELEREKSELTPESVLGFAKEYCSTSCK